MIRETSPFDETSTIEGLSKARAGGLVTSVDLVSRAIDHAMHLHENGGFAFTEIWADESLAASEAADRQFAKGEAKSPIAGIPISIKDNCNVRGRVTHAGSAARRALPPAKRDATCVGRLKSAGAVILGKTNMTELAFSNLGDNRTFGTPVNPRAEGRLVGGSSSGAAVSVADGSVVAAIGTDTGGSVRAPAAFCGLVGFKPSWGRVPLDGVIPLSHTFDSVGPIARSVDSCALVDSILANEIWRPLPNVPLEGLVFGVPTTVVLDDLDEAVSQAFSAAVNFLSRAGATVIEFAWPDVNPERWRGSFSAIARSEFYAVHGDLIDQFKDMIDPNAVEIIQAGANYTSKEIKEAADFRRVAALEAHDLISRFHAVLMPTVPVLPPLVETLKDAATASRIGALIGRNNEIANFFDCCAASIPCQDAGSLPVGLLVLGRSGDDRRILTFAKAIEAGLNIFRFQ